MVFSPLLKWLHNLLVHHHLLRRFNTQLKCKLNLDKAKFRHKWKRLSCNWICNCFHWNAFTNSIVKHQWIKPNANAPVIRTSSLFNWKMAGSDKTSYIFIIPFTPYYMPKVTEQESLNKWLWRKTEIEIRASERREISITMHSHDTWTRGLLCHWRFTSSFLFFLQNLSTLTLFQSLWEGCYLTTP